MSTQPKKTVQPRPTKASMLRTQKQNDTRLVTSQSKPAETEPKPSKSGAKTVVGASDGVRAFMAQQRARMATKANKVEEEPKKKGNFMTGAERYGGKTQDKKPETSIRNIQIIIKQAKSSGKLNISSRGLTKIPDEVLNMYHVDPKSIVVDFTSSGDAWYDNVELTQFIAGDNSIVEIDERLGEEFGALEKLDLRDNKLSSLPDSLQLIQNLTNIYLPYNNFESVPSVLLELKQLRQLDMSHNQLKGTVVVKSNTIEMLDLSHNNINGIEFSDGSNLSKLNVSYNELEELPVAFRNWKRLQDLDISQNRLMCLFPAVRHSEATIVLNALVRLNASKNSILTMVEGDQTQVVLPKLVELVLSTNKLNEAGLGGLVNTPQLQTLDVSSNQLQNIPTAIIHLTQLTRLDVRGNQLRTLPYELGKLDFLKIVHCEGNPMRSFTSMTPTQLIESLRSNYQQQQLQENDSQQQDALANMHVSVVEEMSQQFERKVNLAQRLDLSNKQLNEVSEQELQLQQDVPGTIMLDHNQLTVFPSLLHGLSDFLVTLVLDHNRLSSFSFSIENIVFQQLKTLKLNNNRIKTLECNSHQISFPKLEELSLSHNALTTLPDTMAVGLPSLRIFLASSNKLDDLTEKPFNQRLEILDLSNNDIGSLPSGLSTLESLKELIVFGNRFRVPRPAVVEQGTKAVLEFLKRRHNSSA